MTIKTELLRFTHGKDNLDDLVATALGKAGVSADAVVSLSPMGAWKQKQKAIALLTYKASGGKQKGKS